MTGQRSARALCLTRKLNFLKRISANETSVSLSAQTLASLTDDVNSTCLARECSDLERYFGTDIAEAVLLQDIDLCPHSRDIKDNIAARDRDLPSMKGGLTCRLWWRWRGQLDGHGYGTSHWTMEPSVLTAKGIWCGYHFPIPCHAGMPFVRYG